VGSARSPRSASLPPSFLSSSPATKGSPRPGAVKETSAGCGAARSAARTRPGAPWRHPAAGYSRGQGDGLRKDGDRGNGRSRRRHHASEARSAARREGRSGAAWSAGL